MNSAKGFQYLGTFYYGKFQMYTKRERIVKYISMYTSPSFSGHQIKATLVSSITSSNFRTTLVPLAHFIDIVLFYP